MKAIQVVIRDVPNSPTLESHIKAKAEKITHLFQSIDSFKIIIELVQKHKHQGKLFNVRIDLHVPGKELVVNKKVDEDVYVAVRDAFEALERQLDGYWSKRRGDIKTHQRAAISF